MQHGAACHAARLDDAKVLSIRRALSADTPRSGLQGRLARHYGVSAVTIYKIATGEAWKHLPHAGDPALFEELGQSNTLVETA